MTYEELPSENFPLLTLFNQIAGTKIIEIYTPYEHNKRIVYPVTIDGLKTTFETNGIHQWTAKGFAQALSQELIDYIGSEIENHEL